MTLATPPSTAFDHHSVAALASIRSDGRPHVVLLWFVWDGTAFVMYSKPHALKVRNLRRDPSAMLALGEPGRGDGATALVEVRAEMDIRSGVLPAFERKYAQPMAQLGLSPGGFAAVYSQRIRLIPLRWLDWGRLVFGFRRPWASDCRTGEIEQGDRRVARRQRAHTRVGSERRPVSGGPEPGEAVQEQVEGERE